MDRKTRSQQRTDRQDENTKPAQRRVAPGKVTPTSKLAAPPRPVQARAAASTRPAFLQPPDPAVQLRREEQASLTAQLLEAAVRPDLHASEPEQALPASSSGRALPGPVQARMEQAFGADFSAVRVHEGPQAASIGAQAFTQGSDIHFAPGMYDPASQHGQELLGHELTHVVQQSQGRVQATTQARSLAVNDDASLEREADQMGQKAARGDAVQAAAGPAITPHSPGPAQAKLASPIVQRKGEVPLMKQTDSLMGWAMRQIGEPRTGYDPHFKSLFRRINDYDRSTDGRPSQQLIALDAMMNDANQWYTANEHRLGARDFESFTRLTTILLKERAVVQEQADRLNRFTADANSPYEQMTEEGMLWSHPDYEHNTEKLGKTGKAYFDELSAMNMRSMETEARGPEENGPATEEWFKDFVARASAALSHAVVNHYTTSARAQTMLGDGAMKSKVKLEKESPTFKHNTSAYDDHGLANAGFVFYFIESPDSPMRATRFAEGDEGARPARISIPIEDSGLLDNGWIMLSDFAQREYPDIVTTKDSDRHTSWLPTRETEEKKKKPEFTEKVRHFEPGMGGFNDKDIETMMSIEDPDRRQATGAITPQVRGDSQSKQVYTGPRGKLEIPDRMFNNVLVGADIIPGLATRAALEVARMAAVNPGLADHFKTLDGNALMLFMLKDLFRPQAMVPNSVPIREEHIQTA